MFYTVLVPPAIRADFALFVDSYLSYSEDHNLVLFHKSTSTTEIRIQDAVEGSVSKLLELVYWVKFRAPSSLAGSGVLVCPLSSSVLFESYDLWSFDFNPNRLVSDLQELDVQLSELGCIGVVHLFPLGNVSAKANT
jgi:hypothetical protein